MDFWLAMVIMSAVAGTASIVRTAIRAKHGYPINDENGQIIRREGSADAQQLMLLTDENAALRANMQRLEERVAVLERIATDPAERTAREIENLR